MANSLYLTGYMGAGKSTVGKALAEVLQLPFVDLDLFIEDRSGISIAEMFHAQGEETFRRWEALTLCEVREPSVVALGGGAITVPKVREYVRDTGFLIYLDWPLEVLYKRVKGDVKRPLVHGFHEFSEKFFAREALYLSANLVWHSSPPHLESVESIVAWILLQYRSRLGFHS